MWGLVGRAVLGGHRLGSIVEIDRQKNAHGVAGECWEGQHSFRPADG